jgi:hypothetical protein
MEKESSEQAPKKALNTPDGSGCFKKGDSFKTPSGIIKILSRARETRNHGSGYRIGAVIIPFDEFEKNVEKGLWVKL